jgi:hypothetical protein
MDKMSALTVHDIHDFWLAERLFTPAGALSCRWGPRWGWVTLPSLAAARLLKISHRGYLFLMRATARRGPARLP